MKRYIFSLISLIVLIIVLSLCLGVDVALSIPGGQKNCDTNLVSTSSTAAFAIVPDTSVTVNNGNFTRNCIITFSTELTYTIDSTDPLSAKSSALITLIQVLVPFKELSPKWRLRL